MRDNDQKVTRTIKKIHPTTRRDDDGVVKYESAHLDDVESELAIHSGHSVHDHPLAIAEVRRTIYLHGEQTYHSAGVCGASNNR